MAGDRSLKQFDNKTLNLAPQSIELDIHMKLVWVDQFLEIIYGNFKL